MEEKIIVIMAESESSEAVQMYPADHGDLNVEESEKTLEGSDNSKNKVPIAVKLNGEEIPRQPLKKSKVSFLQMNNPTCAKSEVRLGEQKNCSCSKSKSSPFFIPRLDLDSGDSTEVEEHPDKRPNMNNMASLYNFPDKGLLERIQELKKKFPRIKKSLLYSNSPEFAEYENLLRELSPLCAPNTIYFLHDPVDNVYRGKFSLYCKSNYRSAFKVKSSSSKGYYAVSPHRGFISPGEEIHVVVEVRPKRKDVKTEWIVENIFRHAALGIFTAVVHLDGEESEDIGQFWDRFEEQHSIFVAGHFIKRFFIAQSNGNIRFPSCTHNILESISPSFKNEVNSTTKALEKVGEREEVHALHLYNCFLLETLIAKSKFTESTFAIQIVLLGLLMFITWTLVGNVI